MATVSLLAYRRLCSISDKYGPLPVVQQTVTELTRLDPEAAREPWERVAKAVRRRFQVVHNWAHLRFL